MERYQGIQKAKMPKLGSHIEWNSEGKKETGYIWSKADQPSSYWVIPDGCKSINEVKKIYISRKKIAA